MINLCLCFILLLLNITNHTHASSPLHESLIGNGNSSRGFTVTPHIMDRGIVSNTQPYDDAKGLPAPATVRRATERVIDEIKAVERSPKQQMVRLEEYNLCPFARAAICCDLSGVASNQTSCPDCIVWAVSAYMCLFVPVSIPVNLVSFCTPHNFPCNKYIPLRKLRQGEVFIENSICQSELPNAKNIHLLDTVDTPWRNLIDTMNAHVACPANYAGDIKLTFDFEVWTDGYARRVEDLEPVVMRWVNARGGWKGDALSNTVTLELYPAEQKHQRLASSRSDANVQFNLGLMYAKGLGVEKDELEAARFYRLAADQGDANVQFNLGLMYANGQGVPKDEREAARLFRLAADQRDAQAQYCLGVMYENGQGVPKDEREAARFFKLAADQGNAQAQFNLAVMYMDGQGVPKDEREAARFFKLAADQGDAKSQINLAVMYSNGQGVAKDNREAVRLLRLAADQGDADARDILRQFESKK